MDFEDLGPAMGRSDLEDRIAKLEREVEMLKELLKELLEGELSDGN